MPITRSRALKSNNMSGFEPLADAQPTVPPPPNGKKRKRSRLEVENVASTEPDGENDVTASAITAVSTKKRKRSGRKPPQRKSAVQKPDMPPPPAAVTVKVVKPTPPEVSQKAMRSAGSVIAKFDPWKMRDSTLGDSNGEMFGSDAPIDDATRYEESASFQNAPSVDEPTADGEGLEDDNLDKPHRVGGTDASLDDEVQAMANQNGGLDESATRLLEDIFDRLRSAEESAGNNDPFRMHNSATDDDNVGKPGSSTSASEEPAESLIIEEWSYCSRVHGDDNDPENNLEREVEQEERDTNANTGPPYRPVSQESQIEQGSDKGASFDDILLDAEPPASFQERSPSQVSFGARLSEHTDDASSTCTGDAEGYFDEEFNDSVQFENPLGDWERHYWEERHDAEGGSQDGETTEDEDIETAAVDYAHDIGDSQRGDVLEDCAKASGLAGPSQEPGAEHLDGSEPSSKFAEAKNKNRTTGGVLNADTEKSAQKDDEGNASALDEDIDRTSSVGNIDEDRVYFSVELNYLSIGSEYGAPALGGQPHDDMGPGGDDHPMEEVGVSDENSDDGMSDFLDDADTEQPTNACNEGVLEDLSIPEASLPEDGFLVVDVRGPELTLPLAKSDDDGEKAVVSDTNLEGVSEVDRGDALAGSERTEAMDEDQLSSLFGSTRNTPERRGPDDRDIWGRSRNIASPTPEGESERGVGVGHRYSTGTDKDPAGIFERAPECDQVSVDARAESETQRISSVEPDLARALENAPWREIGAFDSLHTSGSPTRGAFLLREGTTSSTLPRGMEGQFGAARNHPTSEIMETNALLRGIHGTLTQILEIQHRESIENAKFREFVTNR
ncbi:hypothetical protein D9619_002380 [Psilocybe cf. subviscida]|uniref:Uncharacterized protein n=1 Tax=Psilocybe cf. subviscida TaxID=2480587 RepID=A0A8H5AVG2_9AGAR|nr:hypothetical protein D9619_002380 [Psilocybe cf. subviscida]